MLIIEEDEWESALLQRVLVEAGYQVQATQTARDGFARAKAWLPDCIVCDLRLPDIDGVWVARMVRLDPTPLAATPFEYPRGRIQPGGCRNFIAPLSPGFVSS